MIIMVLNGSASRGDSNVSFRRCDIWLQAKHSDLCGQSVHKKPPFSSSRLKRVSDGLSWTSQVFIEQGQGQGAVNCEPAGNEKVLRYLVFIRCDSIFMRAADLTEPERRESKKRQKINLTD